MISVKPGVSLRLLQPQALLAIVAADQTFAEAGYGCTVTSGDDGQHLPESLHYRGLAVDIRTKRAGMSQDIAQALAVKLRARLGLEFQVIVESDHMHIEYDPPKPT